ncbi:hypothetical protein MSPP1_002386 [Malassezia sp. CBS 17886]|nr:hypothetical protein MSPP1_002386 [Malassezia sp. CBS 17886]
MRAPLERIPPEVLERIALYVAEPRVGAHSGGGQPEGPPQDFLHLLVVNRSTYEQLCARHNAALHARIFQAHFDTDAIQRRLGAGGVTTAALAAELPVRFRALQAIRRYVVAHPPPSANDALRRAAAMRHERQTNGTLLPALWAVYLMVLEHDVRNLAHLQWALVADFLEIDAVHTIGASYARHEYPRASPAQCLAMHLRAFLAHAPSAAPLFGAPADFSGYLLVMLKPYVFAAHCYGMFFAPWAAHSPPPDGLPPASDRADARQPRATAELTYCGTRIALAVPPIAHAAIPLLFLCTAQAAASASLKNRLDRADGTQPRPASSHAHDHYFLRLRQCVDPLRAPGMRLADHCGQFSGVWEGRFSFFDLDAYRSMLDGSAASLFDGTYGEQTQVVRLSETVVQVSGDGDAEFCGEGVREGRTDKCALAPRSSRFPAPPTDAAGMLAEWEALPLGDGFSALPGSHELLLSGTGHSAWGSFHVRGRVRIWDGLVVLLKQYGPARHGRWLYRGYSLGGGRIVGRWRDAYTPNALHGYEGPFVLSRRS